MELVSSFELRISDFPGEKGVSTTKKTLRTGIVGTGFAASFHFEALRKVYGVDVEVVGCFTIDTEGDNLWSRPRTITTCNSRYLPRFQALCKR